MPKFALRESRIQSREKFFAVRGRRVGESDCGKERAKNDIIDGLSVLSVYIVYCKPSYIACAAGCCGAWK